MRLSTPPRLSAKVKTFNAAKKPLILVSSSTRIRIRVLDETKISGFLAALKVFTFAESLGGVESLITYPTTQTHADIPQEVRESYGLTPDLLRISIAMEIRKRSGVNP